VITTPSSPGPVRHEDQVVDDAEDDLIVAADLAAVAQAQMVKQRLILASTWVLKQPVDIVHDLAGDPVGHALAGFNGVVVPNVIESRSRVLGYMEPHCFFREARRARTS